eukprot:TRINITY_DN8161_c0_g1_i5.p1 TRINITY_DN8161_c0_g1~~TRINITY_DN8161_c0_g1_i5.p1  ORF type:complete len:948 (-),score=208.46 TRINITY_DN8161_c0_g1_i5:957-3800(-)
MTNVSCTMNRRLAWHGFVPLGRWLVRPRPVASDQPLLGVTVEWARCGAKLAGYVHVRCLPLRPVLPSDQQPTSDTADAVVFVAPAGRRGRLRGPASVPTTMVLPADGLEAAADAAGLSCCCSDWRTLFNMSRLAFSGASVAVELDGSSPSDGSVGCGSLGGVRLWPAELVYRLDRVPPAPDAAWRSLASASQLLSSSSGLGAVRAWRVGNPLLQPPPALPAAAPAAAAATPSSSAAAAASSSTAAASADTTASAVVLTTSAVDQQELVASPAGLGQQQLIASGQDHDDVHRAKRARLDPVAAAFRSAPLIDEAVGMAGHAHGASAANDDDGPSWTPDLHLDFSLNEWLQFDDEDTKRGALSGPLHDSPSMLTCDALRTAGDLTPAADNRMSDLLSEERSMAWYPLAASYRPRSMSAPAVDSAAGPFSYRYTPSVIPSPSSAELPVRVEYSVELASLLLASSRQLSAPAAPDADHALLGSAAEPGGLAGLAGLTGAWAVSGTAGDGSLESVAQPSSSSVCETRCRLEHVSAQAASLSLLASWAVDPVDPDDDREEAFWAAAGAGRAGEPAAAQRTATADQSATVLDVLQQWARVGDSGSTSQQQFQTFGRCWSSWSAAAPLADLVASWDVWSTGEFGCEPLLPPPPDAAWSLMHLVPQWLALGSESTAADVAPAAASPQSAAAPVVPEAAAVRALPMSLESFLALSAAGTEEGELSSSSSLSAATSSMRMLAVEEVPRVAVGYDDSWATVDPTAAVRLWEKSRLLPFAARKDVTYYAVGPASVGLIPDVGLFFSSLSAVYEACCLGQHQPGAAANPGLPAGFVPVDLFDDSNSGVDTDDAVANYMLAAHRLGKSLGAQGASFNGCGVVVVYLLDAFAATLPGPTGGCSLAVLQCASIADAAAATLRLGSVASGFGVHGVFADSTHWHGKRCSVRAAHGASSCCCSQHD